MSGGHVTRSGAAVILDALVRARGDAGHTFFKDGVPTSVQAFFTVHGADLQALLEGIAADIDRNVSVPTAYDVLQIAHRIEASGSAEAQALRRLADNMVAQAAPPAAVWMGVDYAEGVTIDAAQSLRALGDYMLDLRMAYAATATGLTIERNLADVGQWLQAVSGHLSTAEIGRIKPFPMHGMALGGEVGHG